MWQKYKNYQSVGYKLLTDIKNTMTDRAATDKNTVSPGKIQNWVIRRVKRRLGYSFR